jgi:hypothetical protein
MEISPTRITTVRLPTTVLRFFNVYGPHGRPDMMPWQWTKQILIGEPITLYRRQAQARLDVHRRHRRRVRGGAGQGAGVRDPEPGVSNPVENLEFVTCWKTCWAKGQDGGHAHAGQRAVDHLCQRGQGAQAARLRA